MSATYDFDYWLKHITLLAFYHGMITIGIGSSVVYSHKSHLPDTL